MVRLLFALLSSLQIGNRVQRSLERMAWQTAVAGVAALFLVGASAFGLVAAYSALTEVYGFGRAEAAALISLSLLLVALLVLLALPLSKPRRRQAATAVLPPASGALVAQGVGIVDQSLGAAIRQVGPIPLVAIAFVAGLFASRTGGALR
jgi:hypothetical protein